MPQAQPRGFAACRLWKQWWGWDGILSWPRGSLSLSLPPLWLPVWEGSQCENQSLFLVFHVLKGKPWATTWTQAYWHLQGFAERNNFYQALRKFSSLQLVHRSVLSLHNSATRIKVSRALLSFQNNNHN